ncbi:MAG: Uma2 family endonuclease [Pirellulales bacterium]
MASCMIIEDRLEVPLAARTLEEFRRWALSDEFPESGRIDFINGNIEIDMSPENAFTHGSPKVKLIQVLAAVVEEDDIGYLFSDRMRCSSVPADLSAEPDVIFISHDALDSGHVKLIEQKGGNEDDFIEIEGPPDLVVEIVSKSSVGKDTKRLPPAYFKAGVREFWLIDARREELFFVIHGRGPRRFVAQPCDARSFQRSEVLKRKFHLERKRDRRGHWRYDLRVKG